MITYKNITKLGQVAVTTHDYYHAQYMPDATQETGRVYRRMAEMAFYEVVLNGTVNLQQMLAVLHYEVPTPGTVDWQEVADNIKVEIEDHLAPILNTSVSYTGITYREDVPGAVGLTVNFTGGPVSGTSAASRSIPQAAVNVRKTTNSGFRPAQGRVFQGGVSVSGAQANGTWDTNVLDACELFWNAMLELTVLGSPVGNMVIKAKDPDKPNTVPYNPVVFMDARGNPSTVRRRRIGVGA